MAEAFSKKRLLLLGAITTMLAAVLAVVTIRFVLGKRRPTAAHQQAIAAPATTAESSSSFPSLRESDVPGRYRWFHAGVDGGTIQLNADHAFVNKDGRTLAKYRWELAPDGLRIIWQSGQISRFPVMERPGVFVYLRPNGEDSRLEKIEGKPK